MPPHSAALIHYLHRLAGPAATDAELLRHWNERRDQDAFAALVARHGRMVHSVCRRVLGNSHDADDAFQAVFLVLARKASTLRQPEALACWLHGVAVRLARKAHAAASRRICADCSSLIEEKRDPHPDPLDLLSARELLSLIDREIAALPEKYRLPLLMCDVEAHTQPEAARLLGWTLGSLRGRLLRGREKLRKRLLRRGITPEALGVLLAAGLSQTNVNAAVPMALAASVSRLAVLFLDCPTATAIPLSAAALARVGLRGMMLMKLKLLSIVFLSAGIVTAGAGLLVRNSLVPATVEERTEGQTPPPSAKAAPPPPLSSLPPKEDKGEQPPVRLDQVGDPLPDGTVARLGSLRFRHGKMVDGLAYAADGKTLASCSPFNGIRFWDAATGKEIQRFDEQARCREMALSPDGKLLAVTVRRDNPKEERIAIRDFASGRLLRRFGHPQTPANERSPDDLLFSPDGKVLAAYRWAKNIELWHPMTGHHLHTLKGHTDCVWSVAFFVDSKTLVSAGDDKTMRFWDVSTGKQLRQIEHHQGVGKIALSPDGKLLATIDVAKESYPNGSRVWHTDNRVRLWDAASGKEIRQLVVPAKEILPNEPDRFLALCFAPDGKTLLTGGNDGMLCLWDPMTGREVRRFSGFTSFPHTFAFNPDGKSLALVDDVSTIRQMRLADGKDMATWQGHRCKVTSVAVAPDCRSIVTTGGDGTLRFWHPQTGRELRQRAVEVNRSWLPKIQLDGRTYLAAGNDRTYRLYDLASGAELAVLRGHQADLPFALSPDRKTLASLSADSAIRLLDPTTGKVRHTLTEVIVKDNINMLFTADSRTLFVFWDAARPMTVWDAASGNKQGQLVAAVYPAEPQSPAGWAHSATLSPDGRLLAVGLKISQIPGREQQGFLPVLEATTGKETCRLTTGSDGVRQMVFSPDGKSLAWSGWKEGTIYLGEVATGGECRRFSGHRGMVEALAFSADGKMLISGSEDGTALVWDLTGRLAPKGKNDKPLSAADLKSTKR